MQVAPTPPPSLIFRRGSALSTKSNGQTAGMCQACADGFGECLTDREPDATPKFKYGDLPAQVRARSGLVPGQTRGVARLLAVANLTVKTNIRTARRGTLRGTRDSPSIQADPTTCSAYKVHTEHKSYVADAKLDILHRRTAFRSQSTPHIDVCTYSVADARTLLYRATSHDRTLG